MPVIPSDITTLSDLNALLLAVSQSALGNTTEGSPTLAYIAPAPPAFDCCPALIVFTQSIGEEATSPFGPPMATGRRDSFGRVDLVGLVVLVLRCAPKVQKDGTVLTADIMDVATIVQEDGWALWNGITCAIKNDIFLGKCADIHLDSARAINEQGGCVGWAMTLRAEIGGIPCEAGT